MYKEETTFYKLVNYKLRRRVFICHTEGVVEENLDVGLELDLVTGGFG